MTNRLSFDLLIAGQSLDDPVSQAPLQALSRNQHGPAPIDAILGALHRLYKLCQCDMILALSASQQGCFIHYVGQLCT